jgi:hypothetical protein
MLAEELKFLPYLESFVDTLSLGTRQQLAVLLCLIGDPKLIILDEAFNGLDPASSLVLKRHWCWRPLLPLRLASFRTYASSIASPRCLQGSIPGPWLAVTGAGFTPA